MSEIKYKQKNINTPKKVGLVRNALHNWQTIRLCRRFRRKTLKNKSFTYVNRYLFPAEHLYESLKSASPNTTKHMLLSFQEMIRSDDKGRAYSLGYINATQAEENLNGVVAFVSHLHERIPRDHLYNSQIKELFYLLSGDFTLEEESVSHSEIVSYETDETLDPASPYNKLYGGARDLRGVSPSVTYRSYETTHYHLRFKLE